MTLKFGEWPSKTIGHLVYTTSSFVHHFKAMGEFKMELQSGNAQFGQNRWVFVPCDLEIWRRTLKNNRTPLLYYIKLCASFQSHGWIQTGVKVRKRSVGIKIDEFFVPWDLEFRQMTLKKIGHLFYVASSFVHHFIAISEFKLELQSRSAQFGSILIFFVPCDLKIWQTVFKSNRAPFLCYPKLCASFRSHWWIQTGVTVR